MHPIHSRLDPAHRKTYAAFAAGDGMASLLSVAGAVMEREPRSRLLLFYSHRDIAQVPMLEELQALKDRYLRRLALHFFFSDEPQEVELFNGRLDADKITELARTLFDCKKTDDFFLCGPEDLNHAVAGALKALGVEPAKIHGETSHASPSSPGEKAKESAGVQKNAGVSQANVTEVTVLMDGRRRSFKMAMGSSESVLDAAEQAGFELPYSCRAGVCSTCRTKVVKGSVEMKQNYALEPWEVEAGYVLACQSHPTTPELELDYDEK